VGGSRIDSTTVHAFLWENAGPMVDLNSLVPPGSGLTLIEAWSINDRGEIAGWGQLANGMSSC
jgi:probable HAF family extracellular repeat protein